MLPFPYQFGGLGLILPNTPSSLDPYIRNVGLMLHCDGVNSSPIFTDSSLVLKSVTANGNAQISTTQSKFGGSSGYMDGTGDYLSIAHDAGLSFGSGDFTLETWVYPTTLTNNPVLWVHRPALAAKGILWAINPDGTILLLAGDSDTASWNINQSSSGAGALVTTGSWHHLALVRSGSNWTVYLNGSSIMTVSSSFTLDDSGGTILIGKSDAGATNYLDGYIDDFRVTKGVARYTANFTPPTSAFYSGEDPYFSSDSLLLHMDGANGSTTFTDSGLIPKTITLGGNAQISTAQSKFGEASALLDGTGDYIDTPDDSSFTFGTSDWTIEFFARITSFASAPTLLDNRFGSYTSDLVIYNSSGSVFTLYLAGANRASSSSLSTNTWYHIAASKSLGTTRFFIDGVQQGADYTDANSYSETKFRFGANYLDGSSLNGNLDELRITKGVARYTAGFTPPIAAFYSGEDIYFSSVKLLLHGDGSDGSTSITDDSFTVRTMTAVGNAQIDTAQSKFGGSSLLFDETGDAFTAASSTDFDFSTIDFTVEAWIRRTNNSGQNHSIVCRDSIGGTRGWLLFLGDGTGGSTLHGLSFAAWSGATSATIFNATALSLNTWYHVAVTRESGVFKLWIDGVAAGTQSGFTSLSIGAPATPLCVGSLYATADLLAGSSFGGHIEDLRISKNIARYLTGFTPPTTPYPNS